MYNREVRGPLIIGEKSYHQISTDILAPTEAKPGKWWFAMMTIATLASIWGVYSIYITVAKGIGTWGVNNTVGWGWAIINFVWWIGIGHAGTAFSIFLLILRQKWRTSINRAAEAMTVFAVGCAAIFPALHMGRIWLAFFIFPYPNTRGPLWVNFNSPLFWDFIAITAYLLISFSFWYLGMLPDFATIRDRTTSKLRKALYGFFSMGWVGSSRQWLRFESLAFILGGIAAVLLFRGGSHFLRFCHGDDPDDHHPQALQAGGLCDRRAPGCHCSHPYIYQPYYGNSIPDRGFYGLVFRQRV
jgi:molybdopterin-containing oxidoreductase family membrane subunit